MRYQAMVAASAALISGLLLGGCTSPHTNGQGQADVEAPEKPADSGTGSASPQVPGEQAQPGNAQIKCAGDSCRVTVQGAQTLKDLGGHSDWDIQILNIEPNGLTLGVYRAGATIGEGRSGQVGPVTVAVKKIENGKATFQVSG